MGDSSFENNRKIEGGENMGDSSSENNRKIEGGENMGFSSSRNNSRNIRELLTKLPPHYPISGFTGDGQQYTDVHTFLAFDEDTNLAYFSEAGGGLVVVDSNTITLIEFPAV